MQNALIPSAGSTRIKIKTSVTACTCAPEVATRVNMAIPTATSAPPKARSNSRASFRAGSFSPHSAERFGGRRGTSRSKIPPAAISVAAVSSRMRATIGIATPARQGTSRPAYRAPTFSSSVHSTTASPSVAFSSRRALNARQTNDPIYHPSINLNGVSPVV
jgi:hypothetical protein